MRMRKPILALAAAGLLAGCGFQPLYAPQPGGAPAIGAVDVSMIPGKAGHVLRNELDRLLYVEAGAGPRQTLEISLQEEVARLGLRTDESATRADLTLTARYVLTPPDGGRAVRGTVQSVATFEIPTAAFGEIAAQDDARERAAEVLAQRIRADLALRLAQARRS
jgi:LPS-assembly lipoprotein